RQPNRANEKQLGNALPPMALPDRDRDDVRFVGEEPHADYARDELRALFERWQGTFVLFVAEHVPEFAEEAADGAGMVHVVAAALPSLLARPFAIPFYGHEVVREAVLFEFALVCGGRPHRREGLTLDFQHLRDVVSMHGAGDAPSGDPHGLII